MAACRNPVRILAVALLLGSSCLAGAAPLRHGTMRVTLELPAGWRDQREEALWFLTDREQQLLVIVEALEMAPGLESTARAVAQRWLDHAEVDKADGVRPVRGGALHIWEGSGEIGGGSFRFIAATGDVGWRRFSVLAFSDDKGVSANLATVLKLLDSIGVF